jgi:hypothetical protein
MRNDQCLATVRIMTRAVFSLLTYAPFYQIRQRLIGDLFLVKRNYLPAHEYVFRKETRLYYRRC